MEIRRLPDGRYGVFRSGALVVRGLDPDEAHRLVVKMNQRKRLGEGVRSRPSH